MRVKAEIAVQYTSFADNSIVLYKKNLYSKALLSKPYMEWIKWNGLMHLYNG